MARVNHASSGFGRERDHDKNDHGKKDQHEDGKDRKDGHDRRDG
jgi:hypothetical protein